MTSHSKLVIHPKDRSTDFLKPVYENLENVTLITGGESRDSIMDQIKSHDQIMMMGHGTTHGLLSVGQFPDAGWNVIDDHMADLLAEKDNSVFIWCNADAYVRWNELKGFHTGMFISEVGEARMMGLYGTQQYEVDESNRAFVRIMGEAANDDTAAIHALVMKRYGNLTGYNRVAQYNHERLYVN